MYTLKEMSRGLCNSITVLLKTKMKDQMKVALVFLPNVSLKKILVCFVLKVPFVCLVFFFISCIFDFYFIFIYYICLYLKHFCFIFAAFAWAKRFVGSCCGKNYFCQNLWAWEFSSIFMKVQRKTFQFIPHGLTLLV